MMPGKWSLTLKPRPSTRNRMVPSMSGEPITMWPSRRGARARGITPLARRLMRSAWPGALYETTSATADFGASATRTENSTRVAGSVATSTPSRVDDAMPRPVRRDAITEMSDGSLESTFTFRRRRKSPSSNTTCSPPSDPPKREPDVSVVKPAVV